MTDDGTGRRLTCGRYETDGSMVIDIRVQARSSRIAVGTVENGRLKLRRTSRDKSFRISAATHIPPVVLADEDAPGSGRT